jgi:RsiW-degrading membrane proteinase PrsW (M82 family)
MHLRSGQHPKPTVLHRPVELTAAFFALFSLLGAAIGVANSQSSDAVASLLFGAGSVIFLPIFYGILGFVLGLITALLYNLVARMVGGIQIELEETRRPSSATYQQP